VTTARSIADGLEEFLRDTEWAWARRPGDEAYELSFAGNTHEWACVAVTREAERQLLFYSLCPTPVVDAAEVEVLRFLNGVNVELTVGNFELEPGSGQVRLRTSVDVGDEELSEPLVRRVVSANVLLMNAYAAALESVANGSASADEAFLLARGG